MINFPRRLHHNTPGWVGDGSTFHIRIRVDELQARPLTSPEIAVGLLDSARRYHKQRKWWCDLILVMPDHLHALLAFPAEPGMAKTIRDWKRGEARMQGVKWQMNFFDHRIRGEVQRAEKWAYIRRNPVVKGLCADEQNWPWWWSGTLGCGGRQ